jgi:hypothetical protein
MMLYRTKWAKKQRDYRKRRDAGIVSFRSEANPEVLEYLIRLGWIEPQKLGESNQTYARRLGVAVTEGFRRSAKSY